MSSPAHAKASVVPLLLEAFPAPPSFIPPSPGANPPPCRPPAVPLPPVPGPSRFSWVEAQKLLATRDDSISSISMHDLPDDEDDEDELNAITTTAAAGSAVRARRASAQSWRNSSVRPIALSQSTSAIPRSGSPDIPDIISRTPRPRRSASTTFSSRSSSTSRPGSTVSAGNRRRASSPIGLAYTRYTTSSAWEETDFIEDYGEMERQLEGEGSDSDSSLDLHTPLPHLMVKHGLLSPNSKLLPKSMSTDSLTSDEGFDPRASTISVATTKSSILKDSRDTPRRRVRHRDGKLLRGGIGLTTGLGWSDSEDEDAPSPLTRQISNLNLRRAASETGAEEPNTNKLRMTRSSSSSSTSAWRSTMSSGYTAPRSRLSSSSSTSSFNLPRSRASSSSTSSSYNHPPISYNHPPVASRGFDKAFQHGLIKDTEIFHPTSPTHSLVDKDKLLPSLPNPKTGSIRRPTRSQIQVDQVTRLGGSLRSPQSMETLERKRSQSMHTGAPRTLKLPTARAVSGGTERAVPVPRVPSRASGLKPRTGTGMVYRSSGIAL